MVRVASFLTHGVILIVWGLWPP